jgi:YidC/Oxa1 family membrane protein insertase
VEALTAVTSVWRLLIETPLINYLVLLTILTGGSYGLAILLLTATLRAATFPLTLRSLRSTRRMQELQPQLRQLRERVSDPAERARQQQAMMKAAGVNPLGCLGPQLAQIPIFIAVNRVVRSTALETPESVGDLRDRLYRLPGLTDALPLDTHFLSFDLAERGGLWLAMAILVLMLAQQWLSTPGSERRGQTLAVAVATSAFFALFVTAAPAGLGLYWGTSVLAGIILQELFLHRRLFGGVSTPSLPVAAFEAVMAGAGESETPPRNERHGERHSERRRRSRRRKRARRRR